MPLDNVTTQPAPSTVPDGTKIAVDRIPTTLEVVQYVKLMDGTENQQGVIPGGTNGLAVEIKTLPVGGITINDGGGAGSITVDGVFWPATPTTEVGTVRIRDSAGASIALGVANRSTSLPVSIATDQTVIPVSDNTGSLTVDTGSPGTFNINNISGTIASHPVTNAGTFAVQITGSPGQVDTELPPIVAWNDGITPATLGVTGAPPVQAVNVGFNGTNYDRVRVANQGVQVAASTPGILVIQGTGALGAVPISGSITTTAGPADASGFTFGTGSGTPVTPGGFVVDDTASTAPSENQVAAARISLTRQQIMVIEDGGGNRGRRVGVSSLNALAIEGVAGGTAVPVSGSFSLGIGTAGPAKAEDVAAANGDQGIPAMAVQTATPADAAADGDYAMLQMKNGRLYTDAVHPATQVAIPLWGHGVNGAAIPNSSTLHGAQVLVAEPSAIGTGLLAPLVADKVGKLLVLPYCLPENLLQTTEFITSIATPELFAAQGANIRIYITSLTIVNQHATVGTIITLLDGAAAIWQSYVAPAGGGVAISFPTPLVGTANLALNVSSSAAASVLLCISGYKGR